MLLVKKKPAAFCQCLGLLGLFVGCQSPTYSTRPVVHLQAHSSPSVERKSIESELKLAKATIKDCLPSITTGENTQDFWAHKRILQPGDLVQVVLDRNPTITQMVAAREAAAARYPQVSALADPMFGGTMGPATIGSNEVNFAYRLEISQAIPFPGKRGLRGEAANAETAAADHDIEDVRLDLTERARMIFYEYYLVHRSIEVNQENLRLLRDARLIAEDRFKANQAPQQDYLQADVEIGRREERGIMLERARKVALARLNTLMHLSPDSALPPPPKQLAPGVQLPSIRSLRDQARESRPDLRALHNRIAVEQANLGLAEREYYPDFEVMASYDKFMGNTMEQMAPMVGVKLNLPIQKSRRAGTVSEAQARIAQRVADLDSKIDLVNLQVQEAYERVTESEKVVQLYEKSILPRARENVQAARTAYTTSRVPFLSLIEAQRNLTELQDRYHEATAEYFSRLASLERATGGSDLLPTR